MGAFFGSCITWYFEYIYLDASFVCAVETDKKVAKMQGSSEKQNKENDNEDVKLTKMTTNKGIENEVVWRFTRNQAQCLLWL